MKADPACSSIRGRDTPVEVTLGIVSANDLLSELVVILPACLAVVTGAGAWPVRPEYLNRMLTYHLYHGFRKEEVAPGACSSCRDMGETTLVRQTAV